ncbi:MAG TPA: sulfite exporter TauE/SafE family protein [Candidatus Acidoferrales bacterium]|nr:sulfite exporter TauE/SafE family protein [Candidatus Acidoferrales bacterium]
MGVGFFGGVFGLGGGFFSIPLLGFLFSYDQQLAQGTSLVMIVPNTAISLWQYMRRSKMDMRVAIALGVTAMPFAYLGGHVATHMASAPLRRSFAVMMLAVAIFYAVQSLMPKPAGTKGKNRAHLWPLAFPLGAIGGTLSGLFATGGAVFTVPLIGTIFGYTQVVAQFMGLALVFPGTVVNVATYAANHDIVWSTGIALALGGTIAVGWGVKLAHFLPERLLRALFSLVTASMAVALWFRA